MTAFAFDAAGNFQPPSAEELARLDSIASIIAYSYGFMEDGRPYWAYVAVKPSLYQQFYAQSVARQSMVVGDYGTILAAGFESEPPAHIVQQMQDSYGCDPRYEEKLIAEVRKEQAAALSQNEEKRLMDIVAMMKNQKA